MQIFTVDDKDFQTLLEAFQSSTLVGQYRRNGNLQFIKANNRFMMISPADNPDKIAVRPARSLREALELAQVFLDREEARGSAVERISQDSQ